MMNCRPAWRVESRDQRMILATCVDLDFPKRISAPFVPLPTHLAFGHRVVKPGSQRSKGRGSSVPLQLIDRGKERDIGAQGCQHAKEQNKLTIGDQPAR